MVHVACVGISTLDLVMSVGDLPVGGGKYLADGYREIGGGVAANAAVTVAALGGWASLRTVVGDDDVGRRIVDELTTLGVEVEAERVSAAGSPVSMVLVDRSGERVIVNHTPPALFESASVEAAAEIGDADAVLVDCRWPEGAGVTLRAGGAKGVPGIVDFDRPTPEGPAILASASHVVFSADALTSTYGVHDPVDALASAAASTSAWVAVTCGPDGSFWMDTSGVCHEPAFPVEVVDTAGAGDVFHGAFALSLAEGAAEAAAMRFASAAAAVKCGRAGVRAGVPDRSAVEALLSGRAEVSQ